MATATPTTRSFNPGIDGLLGDYQWRRGDPLDYGFPAVGAWGGYSQNEEPYLGYAPITAAQQAAVLRIFAQIESFTNLDFTAYSGPPEQATLRFGRTTETDGAHAYLPFDHPAAGDVWFANNGTYDNPVVGTYSDSTHLHEIGHALGLKHPHDNDIFGAMPLQYDNMNYTVMTYRSYYGMAVEAPFHNGEFGFNQTYMMYDIAALQYLYGADFGPESRNGDSYYVWTPNSGNMTINGVIEHTPGANVVFLTVWDGGGIDTYDLSAYFDALIVDLRPGEWTITNSSQLADLGDGHRAMGNIANALLYQGDERSLIENAVGGSGNDRFQGNQAANTLTGNSGNDYIDGLGGADLMVGGAGDDQFIVENAGDSIVEAVEAGYDRADVSVAVYVLGNNVEEMNGTSTSGGQSLTGNGSNNLIRSNQLNGNVLVGAGGHDTIQGGIGVDTIFGDDGDDIINAGGGVDTIYGGDGNDTINAEGGNDVVDAGGGDDITYGGFGTDQISGGAGSDRLYGDYAEDSIQGGDGNDRLEGGAHGDVLDGGAGDDQLFGDAEPAPYNPDPYGGVTPPSPPPPEYAFGVDQLIGGLGADRIEAGAGTDRIIYRSLADSVSGSMDRIVRFESGTDKIDLSALLPGSLSWSELTDPSDNSLYSLVSFAAQGSSLTFRVDGKVVLADFVLPVSPVITGTEGDDQLDGTDLHDEIVGNGGNDLLRGFADDDLLDGGAGNDRIEGGPGADAMTGGSGNDVFVVDNVGDGVSEAADGGMDLVESSITFALGSQIENLTLTGAVAIAGTGNALANVILGNGAVNQLFGADGDDWLDGGLGADTMTGGLGADLFFVDDPGDQVVELAGEGSDEVRAAHSSYVLADNVERLTGLSSGGQVLTGNALDNVVAGGSGNDRLVGGLGTDQLIGGLGNDVYVFDSVDVILENDGGGTDTVESAFSHSLSINVENLELTGSDAVDGTGNGLNNVLTGNAAANRLDGGTGSDVMSGGLGDDIYFVDDIGDSALEAADSGNDEVRTALATYALGSNIENLTGTSNGGQVLTGNGLANVIAAGSGNDVLDGGLGADVMVGGLGNDIYLIDDSLDGIAELDGQGVDEIRTALAAYSIVPAPGIENLTGLSNFGQTLTGNAANNVILAGFGNDLIDGGLGADTMSGWVGDDVYLIDNAGDIVSEGDYFGIDEVQTNLASLSIAGFAYVENLTGGSADQALTGNGWNNVIDGGLGADAMAGGGGHDVYVVDNVGDTVTELDGQGTDEVRTSVGSKTAPDYALYVLPSFVENLTGTAAGDQGVSDNALDNVITMGGGHDLIVASAGGVDTVEGGGGNDFIYYGDTLTGADVTNGGGGVDTIGLIGNYAGGIVFTAANLIGIERLALYTSLYLPGTGPNTYNVTMSDANVAAGALFFVTAASLQSNESLVFNGSAETNGQFTIHGGAGADTITGGSGSDFFLGNAGNDMLNGGGGSDFLYGGLGADQLTGGAGFDSFRYQSAAQSSAASMDHILDFTDLDRIDLSAIDADGNGGNGNQAFTFIGSGAFTNSAGQLRAYQSGADWFVEGDTNGDGVADLVIQVSITDPALLGLGASDFNL